MPIDTTAYPEMLRDAIAAVVPEWAAKHEQGDQMDEADDTAVVARLQSEISRLHPEYDETRTEREVNKLTTWMRGFGKDFLCVNEHMPQDEPIGTYATLGEYDRENHAFQEKAMAENLVENGMEAGESKPYTGRLSCWVRMIENDDLIYANLATLAHHVFYLVEEGFQMALDEAAPHSLEMVSAPRTGKPKGITPVTFVTTTTPPGREDLVMSLKRMMWDAEARVWDDLNSRFADEAIKGTWRVTNPHDPESMDFVFSDPTAIDTVRPAHFLEDFSALARPQAELEAIVESYVDPTIDAFRRQLIEGIAAWDARTAPAEPG
jgi:hypothetical protein